MGICKASTETHVSQVFHSREQLRVFLLPAGVTCYSIFLVPHSYTWVGRDNVVWRFLSQEKNSMTGPSLHPWPWNLKPDNPAMIMPLYSYCYYKPHPIGYSFLCPLSLTTELLFGVWILEYIQELLPLATPTWRPLPWLTTYGNPAMSPLAGGSWLGRVSSKH